MTDLRDRLADSIREGWHTDDDGWCEVEPNADKLAEHAITVITEELMQALHSLPEQAATRSMDFGRGYSMAIKEVVNIVAGIVTGLG